MKPKKQSRIKQIGYNGFLIGSDAIKPKISFLKLGDTAQELRRGVKGPRRSLFLKSI